MTQQNQRCQTYTNPTTSRIRHNATGTNKHKGNKRAEAVWHARHTKKRGRNFYCSGLLAYVGVEGFDAKRRIFILFYGLRPPGCARCLLRKLHCLIPRATRFAFCTAPRGGEGRRFDLPQKNNRNPLGLRLRFARGR